MPSEQGPLDREPGRSLIAHELVHVAQQRKIGPTSIPREDSSEGRSLESHAQSVERMVAADQPLPLARPHTQAAPTDGLMRAQGDPSSTWAAPGFGAQAAPALQLAPHPSPAAPPPPAVFFSTVQRAVTEAPADAAVEAAEASVAYGAGRRFVERRAERRAAAPGIRILRRALA